MKTVNTTLSSFRLKLKCDDQCASSLEAGITIVNTTCRFWNMLMNQFVAKGMDQQKSDYMHWADCPCVHWSKGSTVCAAVRGLPQHSCHRLEISYNWTVRHTRKHQDVYLIMSSNSILSWFLPHFYINSLMCLCDTYSAAFNSKQVNSRHLTSKFSLYLSAATSHFGL